MTAADEDLFDCGVCSVSGPTEDCVVVPDDSIGQTRVGVPVGTGDAH
jgi:hypothetical protein